MREENLFPCEPNTYAISSQTSVRLWLAWEFVSVDSELLSPGLEQSVFGVEGHCHSCTIKHPNIHPNMLAVAGLTHSEAEAKSWGAVDYHRNLQKASETIVPFIIYWSLASKMLFWENHISIFSTEAWIITSIFLIICLFTSYDNYYKTSLNHLSKVFYIPNYKSQWLYHLWKIKLCGLKNLLISVHIRIGDSTNHQLPV